MTVLLSCVRRSFRKTRVCVKQQHTQTWWPSRYWGMSTQSFSFLRDSHKTRSKLTPQGATCRSKSCDVQLKRKKKSNPVSIYRVKMFVLYFKHFHHKTILMLHSYWPEFTATVWRNRLSYTPHLQSLSPGKSVKFNPIWKCLHCAVQESEHKKPSVFG